ncbi:MAG TPA: ferritin family protein [Burkholderiales bacterium]|jgi:rubrerythrin
MDAPTLYAHAIAIEREAVERYTEFSWRMADAGNDAAAEVFGGLARLEAGHLDGLLKRARGMKLPALAPHEYAWLDAGAPETAARELVYRLMTARHALEIALAGEKRAAAFFEHVVLIAEDARLRALAAEMAADEAEHVALLEQLLETTPPVTDWASIYEKERT